MHELERFPVHPIGLPSLLSDPSAKTPEEALVHIFAEARRTSPSIIYIPQFHLWWENVRLILNTANLGSEFAKFVNCNFRSLTLVLIYYLELQAHAQLRVVLITLLEELPSDLPILLFGTSVPLAEYEENISSVFPRWTMYGYFSYPKKIAFYK